MSTDDRASRRSVGLDLRWWAPGAEAVAVAIASFRQHRLGALTILPFIQRTTVCVSRSFFFVRATPA
jgi:hypothetical protein